MTREALQEQDRGSRARLTAALNIFPVIGIIRGCPRRHLLSVAEGAASGGLTVVEVTLDSPDPLHGIEAIASSFPEVVVGAGTVRDPDEARAAAEAGAAFVVSPHTSEQTIEASTAAGLPSLPGAATPTEIARALDLGAFAVKVFPAAQIGGPDFISAVIAPLGNPRLVPTGGVDATNAALYLRAGALAVGIGGSVFGRDELSNGDSTAIRRTVENLRQAIG